jgi:radical SAM superfamily enzyme YgiQ (UPF0313 family)
MTGRVVLVSPPYHHLPGPFERFSRFPDPPLGLAYLAASIRRGPPERVVEILDGAALGLTLDGLVRAVLARRPDAVGISAATLTAPAARALCRRIKEAAPSTLTLVGGSHPSALPEDLLPDADIAVVGEGEQTVVEVLAGRDPQETPGIAFSRGGKTTVNPGRPPIADLDSLPPPAHDLLPMKRYRYPYPFRTTARQYATAVTSRGCPGLCAFCAQSAVWGERVRRHSVDRVMEDLSTLVERHGVSLLYLYDDTFLGDRPGSGAPDGR